MLAFLRLLDELTEYDWRRRCRRVHLLCNVINAIGRTHIIRIDRADIEELVVVLIDKVSFSSTQVREFNEIQDKGSK